MAYIGTQPKDIRSFGKAKFDFTATQGQTAFTGADDDGKTLGFTDGQVSVYVNGILMDESDYTTSGSNTVTLTSAANLNDIISIVALQTDIPNSDYVPATGGTFSGDVTFDGAFTSQGIDDNATSTAMTLDSSGNLLVGTTSTATNDVGFKAFQSTGQTVTTASGTNPVLFNRKTSDGDIAVFRKDDTTVGSIGTSASYLYIGNGDTGLLFNGGGDTVSPRNPTTGAGRDAAIDLGNSVERFKDLYLSGGVYLGGTGSANRLTDYETGTWSPAFVDDSGNSIFTASPNVSMADYTKIGNLVVASCYITMPSSFSATSSYSSSAGLCVGNLPFVANYDANASYYDVLVSWWHSWTGFTGSSITGHTKKGTNRVRLFKPNGNTIANVLQSNVFNGSAAIILTVTYRTTA